MKSLLAEEVSAVREQALEDPVAARMLFGSLSDQGVGDPYLALVVSVFAGRAVLELVRRAMEYDDAYALRCAQLLFECMDRIEVAPRPPEPPARKASAA